MKQALVRQLRDVFVLMAYIDQLGGKITINGKFLSIDMPNSISKEDQAGIICAAGAYSEDIVGILKRGW